ncbi:MAG: SPOR domain-containing protein [Burkholderiales bacterium]|jgi:DedD protein
MAKAVSNEELQLRKRARRRLVGAVALVVVVVVFLPMVLDNEPKPLSEDIAINIPSAPVEDDGAGTTEPTESGEPEPLHFRPVVPSSDDNDSSAKKSPEPASVPRQEPAPVTTLKTESKKAAATEEGFAVQLGAFSNRDNALRLAKTVSDNRFTAYTEEVMTTNGKRTRVRVGPYPTRAAAKEASERLKARKMTYGEPVIVQLPD